MTTELNAISPMAAYVASFFDFSAPAWTMMVAAITIHWFVLLLPPVALMGYLDRKVGADVQMRIGPNRVSPFGIFQFLADMLKLFFKEDAGPDAQEGWLFRWGVVASIGCVFLAIGSIPMSESWVLSNLDAGIVCVIAALAFSSLCLFWAAYSAQSQWSVLSAFRILAMIASYLVPLVVSLISPILIAGGPSFEKIIAAQGGAPWKWIIFHNPGSMLSGAAMFLSLQIWQARGPFDLFKSPGEIAGGLAAEYSGARLGLVGFLEYLSLFLASAFIVTTFFGGWQTPFNLESFGRAANLVEWLVFMTKIFVFVFVSTWIRWSLPSLRIDQIVNLSWRILVPIGLAGGALTSIWMVIFKAGGAGNFL